MEEHIQYSSLDLIIFVDLFLLESISKTLILFDFCHVKSKIKALIERTAARDLYDVYNMIDQSLFSDENLNLLRKTIFFYLAVGDSNPPQTNFNFNAIDNLKFPQIQANLMPILRKSEHFNFEKAKITVKKLLSSLLIPTEKEKEFIDNFNNKIYSPELLFEIKR